ncbi:MULTISPECIES: TetR/AcrR family transcriptional regulator [Clostridium]|uniref:TetR/AcrR family transcriptional regulator n=1 Tax=Clostridium TaxID=1485 RepID=UPI000826764E|nr:MULTISPECIES: TetR/AcrR family transcriptional regulator [Clostridium]PJI09084.1 TetR/AcrR family transcriptional regulator [Clostridium sp. CT7]
MGIAERRKLEIENLKKRIIDAAEELLISDGYENLSIRKIASKIEYSPGIIYHYFKDKGEIMDKIVTRGYNNMLSKLSEVTVDAENPEKTLVQGLKIYIEYMLENPEQFRAILMNNISEVQYKVNILEKGISKDRESIGRLSKLIGLCIEKGKFRKMDKELAAQIIWSATYGLVSRLILEGNISKEQKDRLINQHFDVIFNGLLEKN